MESVKKAFSIESLPSFWGMALLILLCFSPVFWSVGSRYEGKFFPVVAGVTIVEVEVLSPDVAFTVAFEKVRQCEFVGLHWYDNTDRRLFLDFSPESAFSPKSRPVGKQLAGPWVLHDVHALEETRAVVQHRCHPLWSTYTEFYP